MKSFREQITNSLKDSPVLEKALAEIIGHFWYSDEQKSEQIRQDRADRREQFVQLDDGQIVEFTEMCELNTESKIDKGHHSNRYPDSVYLGHGEVHHFGEYYFFAKSVIDAEILE